MSLIACIDPGKDLCDVAEFLDGRLARHYRARYREYLPPGFVFTVVIEKPVIYPYSKKKPRDLLELTRAGYLLAGSYRCPIVEYEPAEWKGQLPKPMTHVAAWEALTVHERALLPHDTSKRIYQARDKGARDRWQAENSASYYGKAKGSEIHNALDAIAMGLVHLGRIKFV